jgi:hypothetical protein
VCLWRKNKPNLKSYFFSVTGWACDTRLACPLHPLTNRTATLVSAATSSISFPHHCVASACQRPSFFPIPATGALLCLHRVHPRICAGTTATTLAHSSHHTHPAMCPFLGGSHHMAPGPALPVTARAPLATLLVRSALLHGSPLPHPTITLPGLHTPTPVTNRVHRDNTCPVKGLP